MLRNHRLVRGVLMAGCSAVVAAAAAAGPAQAASPFVRDSALCPTGSVTVGGGTQVVGAGTADFRTNMLESAPGTIGGGAQSLWLTSMRNDSGITRTIGLFAVCARAPYGHQVVRKDTVVPAGGFLRSTANCPSGKVVLGGGASVVGEGTADFRTRMQENAPGTTGWPSVSVHLSAVRNHDYKAHTVALHAVCTPAPYGYGVVRKDVAIG